MRLGLLLTRPELACHTFHNGVVDYVPSQAPGQTGGNLPPPLPYSREIGMARMRLLRSGSSFMICSSCLGGQGLLAFSHPIVGNQQMLWAAQGGTGTGGWWVDDQARLLQP